MKHSPRKQILDTLERMKAVPVLVVGDIILDRYIWGDVHRISPEAPVPVVDVRRVENRLGGAGNAAQNLSNLGAKVALCGVVGADEEAELVRGLMKDRGIETGALIVAPDRPTSTKTRVVAQRQQIVRIDHEEKTISDAAVRRRIAAAASEAIDSSRAVIISDYGKGVISPEVIAILEAARHEQKFSLRARPLVVDPHPANYGIYGGMTVAKPNRREAELATGTKIVDRASAIDAARILLKLWKADVMLITLSEDGMVIAFSDDRAPVHLPTVAREVFDVSGAGDTVTAVFTGALASGASPEHAGELANIAAGVVVSEVGTAPIMRDKLVAEIMQLTEAA